MEENPVKEKRKRLNSHVESFVPAPKPQQQTEQPQGHSNDPLSVLVDLLKEMNMNYAFKHEFQRLNDYTDLPKVKEKFEPLKAINLPANLEEYQDAAFFIMRSANYDDIHKAMKYGVWTSTHEHNEEISRVYKQKAKEGKKVVLFFRVATENVLCGAAELLSDFHQDQQFSYWWNKTMWKGIFYLRWIQVKNLDLTPIIREEGSKPLYELTDGSPLCRDNGIYLLEMLGALDFRYEFSIFKFFQLFDQREDYLIGVRSTMDVKIKLQKQERKPSHAEHGLVKSRKQSHVHHLAKQSGNSDHKNRNDSGLKHAARDNGMRRASVPHKKHQAHGKNEHKGRTRRKYSHHDDNGPQKHFVYVKKETEKKAEEVNGKAEQHADK